jgi:predicted nuclease with TOPRIM domain
LEDLKKVDEADRIQVELLWWRLSQAVANYERLQEEKKRISLEESVLGPAVKKLQGEYAHITSGIKEKYGIADFNIETGLEIKPGA